MKSYDSHGSKRTEAQEMNALCIELILSGPRKIDLHPELGSSDPFGHLLNFGALNSNVKTLLST